MTKGIILVVDDTKMIRAAVRYCLEGAGYAVNEAENGKSGLEVLEKMEASGTRPDMILTDVHMPVMDGIEFVKNVKKSRCRFVPILVLTTESSDDKKKEGKRAGASGWLEKPFEEAELLSVVRKFIPETKQQE